MKRIYSLDVLKLYLAYVIAFFHFGTYVAPGSTVTVQIFFLISGFFLGKKFYTRSYADGGACYNQWDYTLDHVKGLYPQYLLSVLLIFGYFLTRALVYFVKEPSLESLSQMGLSLYNQIPDLLLLQSAYHYHDSLNYPLWQLSALLIAGYFVYGLLCRNEKLSRTLIFPAAILMIQSLMYTGVALWGNWGPFYIPLLRAFSPLCIGVLAYYFTTTTYYTALTRHRILFNLASLYSLVSILIYKDHGNIFLITTVVVIWSCWDETSWINRLLNHRCFWHCGELSLAIYLNHALIVRFLEARVYIPLETAGTPAPLWQKNLVFFLMVTGCSLITITLTRWAVNSRKQKVRSGK